MKILGMTVVIDRPLTQSECKDIQRDCQVQLVHLDALHEKHVYSIEFMENSCSHLGVENAISAIKGVLA